MSDTCEIWPHVTAELVTRFWSLVDRCQDRNACWEWQGHKVASRGGYGRFKFKGGTWRAHRLAYVIGRGTELGDKMVLHRCNNPACVRPSHLYLGTGTDNARDRILSGTQYRNEKAAKTGPDKALRIVELHDEGMTQSEIMAEVDATRHHVYDVLAGRTYSWLTGIAR